MFHGPFPPNSMDCVACMEAFPAQFFEDRRKWEHQCQMYVWTMCLSPWHRSCTTAFVEPPYKPENFVRPACARVGAFGE